MSDVNSKYSNDFKLKFYDRLLASIPDLIFQFSVDLSNNIKINHLSGSAIRLFDIEPVKLKLDFIKAAEEKIHPEDFKNLFTSIESAKNNPDKIWLYEFRSQQQTKRLKWFSAYANVEFINNEYVFFGSLSDISNYKEQEEKLRISEERYQFALEASSEGIWDYDVKNNLVFFSSQSMKMLGFEEKSILISREFWDDRMHPEDKTKYRIDFEEHLNGDKPYYKNLQRIQNKNHEYKWILSKGKVIGRDKNNNPSRIIGTHSDISKHIEKENELKRTLEILSEQNKRLTNFAHIVSHNLRSHAGNFKMLLDIIETENDPEVIQESMIHLRTNSNELTETIDNLKDLVEIQSNLKPTKEPLNLSQYLKKVLNLLSEEFTKHEVEIDKQIPAEAIVNFNPAYLESILLNFTTNAIKYSHPDRKPRIEYIFHEENSIKYLTIKDNGMGIDMQRHGESLFGMYKTFHKHPNSRGIGLFISKNQIEAMGCKVEVESEVGVGSSFKIIFND